MTADDILARSGLKRREIERCVACGGGLAKSGPIFYRVRVERFIFDSSAIQRRHGLEEFFGGGTQGAALAEVMGDDADLAKTLDDPPAALLCQACAMRFPTAVILESQVERAARLTGDENG